MLVEGRAELAETAVLAEERAELAEMVAVAEVTVRGGAGAWAGWEKGWEGSHPRPADRAPPRGAPSSAPACGWLQTHSTSLKFVFALSSSVSVPKLPFSQLFHI